MDLLDGFYNSLERIRNCVEGLREVRSEEDPWGSLTDLKLEACGREICHGKECVHRTRKCVWGGGGVCTLQCYMQARGRLSGTYLYPLNYLTSLKADF